jgi:stress-induced morphogen
MVEPNVVEERIRAGLEGVSHVAVRDLTGTKDHYEATIVATAFAGLH